MSCPAKKGGMLRRTHANNMVIFAILMKRRAHRADTRNVSRCFLAHWSLRRQTQGIKVITAECLNDNIGSIRVLEKVGMRRLEPEGHLLKWELRNVSV